MNKMFRRLIDVADDRSEITNKKYKQKENKEAILLNAMQDYAPNIFSVKMLYSNCSDCIFPYVLRGSIFSTFSTQAARKRLPNPTDTQFQTFLRRRILVSNSSRNESIAASYIDLAHVCVVDAITNPFSNSFYSSMPINNPLCLSSRADRDSKPLFACRLSQSNEIMESEELNNS